MNKPMHIKNLMIKIINNSMIDLPAPSSISLWWNFGSLLSLCLMIQITSGLFLAMNYTANTDLSFDIMINICRNINYGWLMRTIHANGASMFFMCIYFHIGRGLYYNSIKLFSVWTSGLIILFMLMATAFLGYVLPWGQMSLWGASVITNLLSAIPCLGLTLVNWLWGSFSVSNATLTRFYALHFILPFIISALIMMHLLMLHQTGSNNPMGLNSNYDKSFFHPYFSIKDTMGFIMMMLLLSMMILYEHYMLMDSENFIPPNPLTTPVHIQPEWYFLFAYAILQSIPNKLGGVIASILSILMLMISLMFKQVHNTTKYPINKLLYWLFITNSILLTWISSRPAEEPFIMTGQLLTITYFVYFLNFLFNKLMHN